MLEHITVLKEEAVEALNIKEDGIYVDMTLGGGGHSSLILSKLKTGHLYSFDQDDFAIEKARKRLEQVGNNFTIIKSNFKYIKSKLEEQGITKVDGVLYDLGVSSFQFDDAERGFSYRMDAPLDMRMDRNSELSAKTIVNEWPVSKMIEIFYKYGEEKFSKQIAYKIDEARKEKPINTTFELVDIIKSALPAKVLNQKGHPAKKVFQALRVAVNDELRVFEYSLNDALSMLNKGGRCVVISFQSLEDKICKHTFKEASTLNIPANLPIQTSNMKAPFTLITRNAVVPSDEEVLNNNRSHSAKMRVLEKN